MFSLCVLLNKDANRLGEFNFVIGLLWNVHEQTQVERVGGSSHSLDRG